MSGKPKKTQRDISKSYQQAGPYLNIGYFFISAMGLFGFTGYKIDEHYLTKPLWLLVGLFAGLALGFYNMMKILAQLKKPEDD